MTKTVDIFVPCDDFGTAQSVVDQCLTSTLLRGIYLLTNDSTIESKWQSVTVDGRLLSSETICNIAETANSDYVLLLTKPTNVVIGEGALERMVRVASDTNAMMVYADHYEQKTYYIYYFTEILHCLVDL